MMLVHDCGFALLPNNAHSLGHHDRFLRHSIVASTPFCCKACRRRPAAIAAPPVLRYVLRMRTFKMSWLMCVLHIVTVGRDGEYNDGVIMYLIDKAVLFA